MPTILKITAVMVLVIMLLLAVVEFPPAHCESDSCFYATRTTKG